MMTAEFALLLGISLVLSLGWLTQSARIAAQRFNAIRQELADCPQTRELHFTIRETVVSYNDGKVVPLPVRPARLARQEVPLRAAA